MVLQSLEKEIAAKKVCRLLFQNESAINNEDCCKADPFLKQF